VTTGIIDASAFIGQVFSGTAGRVGITAGGDVQTGNISSEVLSGKGVQSVSSPPMVRSRQMTWWLLGDPSVSWVVVAILL
jgi:hypothetical protein